MVRGVDKKGGLKVSRQKLTIGKQILLVLAFLADCLDEARLLGGLVGLTFQQTYGWIPPQYKRKNFYSQVKRFIDKGYVKKVGKGKNSVLAPTAEGRIKAFSLSGCLWPEQWDGQWTTVFFDIRETSRSTRDKLRNFLKRLKFGMLQRSVWIFPGDFVSKLRRLMTESRLQDYVLVISCDDLGVEDQKALVERIWRVSALNRKYKKLAEEVGNAQSLPTEKQAIKVREFKKLLLDLLSADSMLSLALLPDDWVGKKVIKSILELERKSAGMKKE